MSPSWRLLAGLALVSVALFAASRFAGRGDVETPAPRPAVVLPASAAPADYAAAVARLDNEIAGRRAEIARDPRQWVALELIASAAMARARLSGDYAGFGAARAALDGAFEQAAEGAGPHLARAGFAMQIHRLAAAEADLAAIGRYAVPPAAAIRAEAAALAGDIAFYRGRYALAARRYDEADALAPGAGVAVRRANLLARTGAPREALAHLDSAAAMERFTTSQAAASLLLQRGAIHLRTGDWDAAERAFAAADTRFAGYWLTAAHRAQMRAARGDLDGAAAAYTRIAASAPVPEVMDALAAVHRARGDFAAARRWADRAGAIWDERLALFPEAAQAHAFEHHLNFGDPRRALALAQADFAARPHGGSATALGWALLANGRPAEALRVAGLATATGWVSAETHLVAAEAHAALGDGEAAQAARDEALAIDPRILDPGAAMLWFSH